MAQMPKKFIAIDTNVYSKLEQLRDKNGCSSFSKLVESLLQYEGHGEIMVNE
jgi:predicted CopG family antitoxin